MKEKTVVETLKEVMDPELGVSVYDLGLIYDINVEPDKIGIEMTLTNPHCPFMQKLQDEVRQAIEDVAGGRDVQVQLVFEPVWTPERMSPAAKEKLGWTEE